MNGNEIVGIADVMCDLQYPLHELVKFVHVDVHEQLASQVADGKAGIGFSFHMKTVDELAQKPKDVGTVKRPPQDAFQNFMVDAGKKFPDVALQNPDRPCVVTRYPSRQIPKAIDCPMGTLIKSTRIGTVF